LVELVRAYTPAEGARPGCGLWGRVLLQSHRRGGLPDPGHRPLEIRRGGRRKGRPRPTNGFGTSLGHPLRRGKRV
jgi:hypothetical protein